jgi:hypothetical protein
MHLSRQHVQLDSLTKVAQTPASTGVVLHLVMQFDTITEGIGLNRLTANFHHALVDGAFKGEWCGRAGSATV